MVTSSSELVGVLGVEAYFHRHAKNTGNIEPFTILMTHGYRCSQLYTIEVGV